MQAAIDLARRFGLHVEFADLGDWHPAQLRAEYDPDGALIRVNLRLLKTMPDSDARRFALFAVAHEIYHHREACGQVPRLRNLSERERAADAFARELLACD